METEKSPESVCRRGYGKPVTRLGGSAGGVKMVVKMHQHGRYNTKDLL